MSLSVQGNGEHELPDLNPTALAVAYAFAIMEDDHPGFLDRLVAISEDDSAHAEIRRLREPPPNPAIADLLRRTTVLVRHIRFVAKAHRPADAKAAEPPKRRWWRAR